MGGTTNTGLKSFQDKSQQLTFNLSYHKKRDKRNESFIEYLRMKNFVLSSQLVLANWGTTPCFVSCTGNSTVLSHGKE